MPLYWLLPIGLTDEHNHLLRHFFHIKQTATVSEYVEQFIDIVHQLLPHDPSIAPSVITNRFVDGLRKDIRTVVMVHRPQDLDVASSLAFLQEEASPDHLVRKNGLSLYPKKNSQEQSKISYVPVTNQGPPRTPEDKRSYEGARSKTREHKLSALKSYRRGKGLCYKCGEKWSPRHKCPAQVSECN